MMEDSSSNSMEVDSPSDFYLVGSGGSIDHEQHNNNDSLQSSSSNHMEYLYGPTLDEVNISLRWAFWLHSYGFGCLFFFLAFYSFFSILNLRSQLSTRPYMTTINSFLCLLGTSRAAVLFIDPYGLEHRMPPLMGSLLWDLGFPSLISSFSLIQIAFLQLTQVDVGPETFRKKTCLSLVITLHFLSAIISSIYSGLNSDLMVGKMVTQLLFSIWGLGLSGSFLVCGKQALQLLSGGSSSSSGAQISGNTNDKGIANLFGMGMMAPGGGQNLTSSLTAALAPTLLQGSSSSTADKDTPKIKITDEHDHIVSVASASDSSRGLNDIPELPEGNNGTQGPSPIPSPRSSFSGPGGENTTGETGGSSSSSTYVRPPSPVLPRRKSSGTGMLRGISTPPGSGGISGGGPRRLSWNTRKDSGGGELLGGTTTVPEARKKSLTWCEESVERVSAATEKRRASRKSFDATVANEVNNPDRNGVTDTLLVSSAATTVGADYTLQSILSHIAYVNQTALDYRLSRKLSRTNQVHKVVKYTSYTAALGFAVCIGELVRLISPLGLLASDDGTTPSIWLWFILHSLCRGFEFAMGATVANITKQPVSRPAHYAFRHKHHRDSSLYL